MPKNLFIWKIIQNENKLFHTNSWKQDTLYLCNGVMPLPHESNSMTKNDRYEKEYANFVLPDTFTLKNTYYHRIMELFRLKKTFKFMKCNR